MSPSKVSLIILVHNAPRYVITTLNSLQKTKDVSYETIVVDNKSNLTTRIILFLYFIRRKINRLLFLDENTLFSRGNNIGSLVAGNDATHILLLNSDIRINDPLWLKKLLALHEQGATSLGVARGKNLPPRADGFCFLIDRDLYLKFRLDEFYEHWWSLTKLQAELLKSGFKVKAVRNHENLITHFEQKSGKVKKKTRKAEDSDVRDWFSDLSVEVVETL